MKPFLVCTDLDGTLLDHDSYSWQAAQPAMKALKKQGAQVVINTSKTYAEVKELVAKLSLDSPFIVENGSAIFFPKAHYSVEQLIEVQDRPVQSYDDYLCVTTGTDRRNLLNFLAPLNKEFKFSGYSDWTIDEVVKHTGLGKNDAEDSASRLFSEPFLWHDTEAAAQEFSDRVKMNNFNLLKGGRFFHVIGATDKGKAILELKEIFRKLGDEFDKLICLGDSQNDCAMLEVADFPIVVRSEHYDYPKVENTSTIYSKGVGPVGWNVEILKILTRHQSQ